MRLSLEVVTCSRRARKGQLSSSIGHCHFRRAYGAEVFAGNRVLFRQVLNHHSVTLVEERDLRTAAKIRLITNEKVCQILASKTSSSLSI
jgi:hypothetical protein